MRKIAFILLSFSIIASVFAGSSKHQDHQMKDSDAMRHGKSLSDNKSHSGHDSGHDSLREHADSHHGEMSYSGRENAVTQASKDGLYKLFLFSNQSPIPLQKIHSWTLRVETADGKPGDNLKIFVNGGMPMHRHGFPTKPRMSEHLGDGNYRVDGIKFNMAGHWEMRFNVTEKGKPAGRGNKDRAVFKIHLK